MQLSDRLLAVAGLIREGKHLADVGTDHGYIPIYLVQHGVCESAVAMDIREGPLMRAKEHVYQYQLEDKIRVRLSDGVKELKRGEADCMTLAGVGGALTIHILEDGWEVISDMTECVLQPQSEIGKVRKYLWKQGFAIVEEDMVFEDGKYYPMMRIVPPKTRKLCQEDSNPLYELDKKYELYMQYGQFLLEHRHPVLRQFLDKENVKCKKILETLKDKSPDSRERVRELEDKRLLIQRALEMY